MNSLLICWFISTGSYVEFKWDKHDTYNGIVNGKRVDVSVVDIKGTDKQVFICQGE